LILAISSIDAAIVAIYFAGVIALGLWVGRGQRDLASYFLGDRNLPWWAVLLSIVATETSTVTFLSVPGLAFDAKNGDFRFLQLALGLIVGRLFVVWLLLPLYFRGELFTAYEVLDRRFGGATKRVASLVFLVARNLGDGLRLFLTAIVVQHVLGWDLTPSIVLSGAVTIVYTYFGGMKSVVWNDCLQFVIYIAGAVLAGYVIVSNLPGGWSQLVEFGHAHDKFRLFDFSFSLTRGTWTFWTGLIGGMFLTMGTHGADQMMVQRYLGARGQREAGLALGLSGIVVLAQFALFLLIGVGLACFYDEYPPAQPFARNDEVFSAFIVERMGVGAVGLLLAAVFSAAMSTLSSSLNSSATALISDFYLPLWKSRPSDRHLLYLSRMATLLFGVVQIGVAIAAVELSSDRRVDGTQPAVHAPSGSAELEKPRGPSIVERVLTIAGFAWGLILGLFFLAIFSRQATQPAALVGLVGGLAAVSYVAAFTRLNSNWYTVVGSLTTLLIGLAASRIGRSPAKS